MGVNSQRGTGNQTQVCWKSSQCFYSLSHLSSPTTDKYMLKSNCHQIINWSHSHANPVCGQVLTLFSLGAMAFEEMWLYVHYRKERRTLFLKLSLYVCICMYVCMIILYMIDVWVWMYVCVSLLVHVCIPIYVEIRGQSQEYTLTFRLCFRQGLICSAANSRLSDP